MSKDFKIAVDFDGTIVEHDYPHIGPEVPGAIDALKRFQTCGATIILWTMRCGDELLDAVAFLRRRGIAIAYANQHPDDREWTTSPKVYAHVYIDDAAFGCPLVHPNELNGLPPGSRPYVDWSIITPFVIEMIKQRLN